MPWAEAKPTDEFSAATLPRTDPITGRLANRPTELSNA